MILCCGPLNKKNDRHILLIENDSVVFSKKINREKDLLATLEPLIKKHAPHIEGFCALMGDGTFSAVREAVTIVNGLAMVRGVPAKSIAFDPIAFETAPENAIKTLCASYNASKATRAEPIYSAPPTITTPKNKSL